ncbi:hypothetical protein ZQ34_004869 [Salmonella enterica subsp. salamae]|uniref:hypothetical protein n=1 Tax=Salmonella enterica TaxID=28901 RepID=UPI0012FD12F2|nr:hypothetical protein [Salmonella enterica]EDV1506841.1 hypothetical protein [Salmonella enterica subsp. salamae]EED7441359.1 hypothetical protein [Salmonella enterica subsp. salamae]EEI9684549.1 hypothetical protein [Salmonella enterica]EKN4993106.1 hypothetical protein [Salmonella enterica]EKT4207227.1 hypothetical protein [Salmonella enterica]
MTEPAPCADAYTAVEGTVTERGIRLDTDTEDGSELYLWLHTTADNLLASFPTVGQ